MRSNIMQCSVKRHMPIELLPSNQKSTQLHKNSFSNHDSFHSHYKAWGAIMK